MSKKASCRVVNSTVLSFRVLLQFLPYLSVVPYLLRLILRCVFRFDCYYAAVDAFHQQCFNVGRNDWALRQLTVFVSLCQVNLHSAIVGPPHTALQAGHTTKEITEAVRAGCTHPPIHGIH